ncbi:hypothetical protein EIP86_007989 [Pleurotus ostreatoroseus]|nr:hypothetical protein EIP86_007989 [Pleurotus ostreatoroseus]
MQGQPELPQEVQELVIDENGDDTVTLLSSSLVNHAWYARAHRHLFACLRIRAMRCRPLQLVVNAQEVLEGVAVPQDLDPTFSFEKALATLPHTLGGTVTHLVLTSASGATRMKNAAQGIQLLRPELTACTVKAFIEQFPRLHSITIEDVEWADCPRTQEHCDCMEVMDRRIFSSIVLRNVWHHFVGMNATYVTQCAAQVHELVVEGLKYQESARPPYPEIAAEKLTFGTAMAPPTVILPELQVGTLQVVDITTMCYLDIDLVCDLLETHGDHVKQLGLSVYWLELELQCIIREKDVESNRATQSMLLKIVDQAPESVARMALSFKTVAAATRTPLALLTGTSWARVIAKVVSLPRLEQFAVILKVSSGELHKGQESMDAFAMELEDMIRLAHGEAVRTSIRIESTSMDNYEFDEDE